MKVTIIIPVIRPKKLPSLIEKIIKNVGIPKEHYEIKMKEDKEKIGCPKMVKHLTNEAKYDMICFLGDDTDPQPDFLKNALKAMEKLPDGWGLVGLADGTKRNLPCHWLAHKKLLPLLDGEFFHTKYKHLYCDMELKCRVNDLKRFVMCDDAVVLHNHPFINDSPTDEYYKKIYSPETQSHDAALFANRHKHGWKTLRKLKVAIGVPSGYMIHTDFAMSLINLVTFSTARDIDVGVINVKNSIISIGRTDIVKEAAKMKADKLLYLDSDMLFPADTLVRLLLHQKPIVCTDAMKKLKPHHTVVKKSTNEKGEAIRIDYKKCKDLETIAGLSTGVLLVDMSVFNKIGLPFFHVDFKPEEKKFIGEDFYFGYKCKEHGYELYCDTKLSKQIGHMGVSAHYIP